METPPVTNITNHNVVGDGRLLVTVELGATVQVGDGDSMSFIKPRVVLHNLDPEADVPAQVARALETSVVAFAALDGHLEAEMVKLISGNVGQPTFAKRVDDLERQLSTARENVTRIAGELKRQKAQIAQIVEVSTDGSSEEAPASS